MRPAPSRRGHSAQTRTGANHKSSIAITERPRAESRRAPIGATGSGRQGAKKRACENGHASATPITDGKFLYVFFGKSGVYAFDHMGSEQWHADVGSKAHGWGTSASPVLYKDLVFINASVESRLMGLFSRAAHSGSAVGVQLSGSRESTAVAAPKSTGLALRELPSSKLRTMGLPYGLAVVQNSEAAERAGLRVGDVVYGVEQRRFRSLEAFYRLVSQRKPGPLSLLVRRGKSDLYLSIEFGGPDGTRARDTLLRT